MKEKTLVTSVADLEKVMSVVEQKWRKYEECSFYEYLVENTKPTSGKWSEWFGWFLHEWILSDDNTFDGRKFYNWLLNNYADRLHTSE
jgi:hypothetical protein